MWWQVKGDILWSLLFSSPTNERDPKVQTLMETLWTRISSREVWLKKPSKAIRISFYSGSEGCRLKIALSELQDYNSMVSSTIFVMNKWFWLHQSVPKCWYQHLAPLFGTAWDLSVFKEYIQMLPHGFQNSWKTA